MKFNYLFVFCLLTLFACKKDTVAPIDLPEETVDECGQIKEGNPHPNQDAFQAILDNYIQKGLPGISALIYTPEGGLWQGTAGYSNIEDAKDLLYCDVMYSGSVAKLYTVTAAMKLYEEGILDLDAPVRDYLSQRLIDSLPNAQEVTVRQLMNHTAGMPDIDDDPEYERAILGNNGVLSSAEDQLSFLFDDAPNFKPGEMAQYSSTHTMTLALVLDNITNKHHSYLISEKIINALGLKQTYYKNEPGFPSPDKLVTGYLVEPTGTSNINDLSVNYLQSVQGDAGIVASAHDYFLFLQSLIETKLVSPATLDLMMEPEWAFEFQNVGLGFGLGFIISKMDETIIRIGHSGSTVGGNSHLYYYPKTQSYLVLLTNATIFDEPVQQSWGGIGFVNPDNPNPSSLIEEFEAMILQ